MKNNNDNNIYLYFSCDVDVVSSVKELILEQNLKYFSQIYFYDSSYIFYSLDI